VPAPAAALAVASAGSAPFPTPIDALGRDLGDAFGGTHLLFYAGAVGASAAMALGGADQAIRDGVQEHFASRAYGNTAVVVGYVLPVVVAPGVWLTGAALGDRASAGAGSAAVQSLAVTAASVFVLKVSVGRVYPPENAHTFTPLQSWRWPFPAWPSGHGAAVTSVVAALAGYYGADELWIPFVGYPVALAVGLGLLSGDEHWASDLLAGAVLGQCIGWSIGRAFRARARGEPPPTLSLVPMMAPSSQGVAISGTW
jgi:membrane-associated phospholipid phosphatase